MKWLLPLLAGCRAIFGIDTPEHVQSDAPPVVDGVTDMASDVPSTAPWGVPAVQFAGGGDDDPTLTGDMLEMYFNRANDIYVTTRASLGMPWTTPTVVAELSSVSTETTPEISLDGLTIWIASDRTGTAGLDDIWVATRATRDALWGTPARVAELSSATGDAAGGVSGDELTITVTQTPSSADLYISTRATNDAAWGTPVALTTLNGPGSDFSPDLSPDALTIYFDSNRLGQGQDLFVATRAKLTDDFSAPQPITELNTASDETDAWISPDGHHLFFARAGTIYESVR